MKFPIVKENEIKRENAYKAILVVSLSFTICSWACMTTVIPFVYHLMTITNDQFNNILEYCEETAQTAAHESQILLENKLKQSEKKKIINQFNLTNNLSVIFFLIDYFLNLLINLKKKFSFSSKYFNYFFLKKVNFLAFSTSSIFIITIP